MNDAYYYYYHPAVQSTRLLVVIRYDEREKTDGSHSASTTQSSSTATATATATTQALERENAELRVELGKSQLECISLKEQLEVAVAAQKKKELVPELPKREPCEVLLNTIVQLREKGVIIKDVNQLVAPPKCTCYSCIDAAYAELDILRAHRGQ